MKPGCGDSAGALDHADAAALWAAFKVGTSERRNEIADALHVMCLARAVGRWLPANATVESVAALAVERLLYGKRLERAIGSDPLTELLEHAVSDAIRGKFDVPPHRADALAHLQVDLADLNPTAPASVTSSLEPGDYAKLTWRQLAIIRRLAAGESLKVIGDALGLSRSTLSGHVHNAILRIQCDTPQPAVGANDEGVAIAVRERLRRLGALGRGARHRQRTLRRLAAQNALRASEIVVLHLVARGLSTHKIARSVHKSRKAMQLTLRLLLLRLAEGTEESAS